MCKYKNLQAGQLPLQHLSFLQNLLNFIITKNLEQEVHDDLSIYVNERSPCGFSIIGDKDLLMARDQKVMTILTQWRNTLWTSIKELFLLLKFDHSSPSVTRDKRFVKVTWLWGNDVTTSLGRGLNWTLSMRFAWCPNLLLTSPWLIYRFSNQWFCWFRAVQMW